MDRKTLAARDRETNNDDTWICEKDDGREEKSGTLGLRCSKDAAISRLTDY